MDPSGKFIYIADTSLLAYTPALIVYNVDKELSYRLLSGLQFMYGSSIIMRINSSQPETDSCSSTGQCPATGTALSKLIIDSSVIYKYYGIVRNKLKVIM